MRTLACLLPMALVACTQFPELDASVSPDVSDAAYPDLVPLEPLLAGSIRREDTLQTEQSVIARADALRQRASRLRGRVVDSATRARMSRGVNEG